MTRGSLVSSRERSGSLHRRGRSRRPVRGLPARPRVGRDARPGPRGPHPVQAGPRGPGIHGRRRDAGTGRRGGPQLPRPGDHLRLRRGGAALPARLRAAGHRDRGVVAHRVRRRPAGPRPGGASRGRLQPRGRGAPGRARGHSAAPAHRLLGPLPPRRRRHPAGERRPRPRLRGRPHPRRGGPLPRPRGQRPRPLRGLLRHLQPARDGQRLPGGVRDDADPAGRRLPGDAPRRPPGRRARRHGRPDGRRAHARRLQLRLLRARAARADDGCRARRGPRPLVQRRPGEDEDDPGRPARPRHLPADRRRLPRPGPLPRRLDARGGGTGVGRPQRSGHGRECHRQRRRRRQAHLLLRARPDPLLPRGGADPGQRRHLQVQRARCAAARPRPPRRDGRQAGRRLGRQGPGHRPARGRQDPRPAPPPADRGPPRVDRAAGRQPLDGPDRHRRQARPAARRPPAVRGQRRRPRPRPARRPDPGRAARGRARRQLQPGRRLQGHLGARRPCADPPQGLRPGVARGRRHEHTDRVRRGHGPGTAAGAPERAAAAQQQQQRQQQRQQRQHQRQQRGAPC